MVEGSPLVVSLLPREFRVGQAPNFAEMAEIVYSFKGTENLPVEELVANRDDIDTFLASRFRRLPDVVVVYEPWDATIFDILRTSSAKILLLTEDLHLRPLSLLRSAVSASALVLARFNIIEGLLGENLPQVRSFPLHCSDVFLSEPNEFSHPMIIHFGNLETDPPNIDPARSPGANQYQYRKDWHHRFQEAAGDRYVYLRLPPDQLRQAMSRHSFGFSSTYFPYSFTQQCLDEQGEEWAEINRPRDASKSYLVAKFLEIPGAGLLMLADPAGVEDALHEAGFVDGENYIAITPFNLREKLDYIFDSRNLARILDMRRAGYDLVRRRHTIEARKQAYRLFIEELTTP